MTPREFNIHRVLPARGGKKSLAMLVDSTPEASELSCTGVATICRAISSRLWKYLATLAERRLRSTPVSDTLVVGKTLKPRDDADSGRPI